MRLLLAYALACSLLLAAFGCKGPNQPSLYGDYSYLEYDGEQGGVGRVGVNVPLGAGFRDPDEDADGRAVARLTGAVLALVERIDAAEPQGATGPTGDVPAPADAPDAAGDGGAEGLDDQAAESEEGEDHVSIEHAAEVREEIEAWSWRSVGMLAVLGLVGMAIWAGCRAIKKYLG